jgi:hypothetical protein
MKRELPPSQQLTPKPVSWISLLRTVRAPLSVIVLAGVAVVLPPQSRDMLAALGDGNVVLSETFIFYLSLALLTFSGWYWSRALISARFDVPYTDEGRARLEATEKRLDVFAFDAVPWLIFMLVGLVGVGLIVRSGVWQALWFLLAWLGVYVVFRPTRMKDGERQPRRLVRDRQEGYRAIGGGPQRSTSSPSQWWHDIPTHMRLLTHRTPGGPLAAWTFIGVALALFVWGAVASFITFAEPVASLPVLLATFFTGPSGALICLALMIAPLSLLTFVADGFRIEFTIKGRSTGPSRPPLIGFLLLVAALTPYLFHLHTVRVIDADLPARQSLAAFFRQWAEACAPREGPVRPIIVAVSGGASRAAVWGAQVLQEVEEASVTGGPAVFAVSSVSGGSLGVAGYMALLAKMKDDERCAENRDRRRKQTALLATAPLGDDVLSALLAGWLAADIPRSLLSPFGAIARIFVGEQPRGGDRAEAIERAFELSWAKDWTKEPRALFKDPFLSLFYDRTALRRGMPLWIANGTEVHSGSRLLTLPVDKTDWPFRASRDVLALLKADVPISTAINNTARFPYLEPSGELLPRKPPQNEASRTLGDRFCDQVRVCTLGAPEIIDGGYFENEGLQTALELAAWLETEGKKIVNGREVWPIIVQATADGTATLTLNDVVRWNSAPQDPGEARLVSPSLQLLAPILGLYNVRGGHSAVLLRAAKDIYKTNFVHFMLPGDNGRDVPLNWVLSADTASFIRRATRGQDALENAEERKRLHELLRTTVK